MKKEDNNEPSLINPKFIKEIAIQVMVYGFLFIALIVSGFIAFDMAITH